MPFPEHYPGERLPRGSALSTPAAVTGQLFSTPTNQPSHLPHTLQYLALSLSSSLQNSHSLVVSVSNTQTHMHALAPTKRNNGYATWVYPAHAINSIHTLHSLRSSKRETGTPKIHQISMEGNDITSQMIGGLGTHPIKQPSLSSMQHANPLISAAHAAERLNTDEKDKLFTHSI